MNLNPKKCKEMTICTLRTRTDFLPLLINNLPLENVPSYKLLGLTKEILTKASMRLYILRVLKGAGIPSSDFLNVYFALIRSVLEYCCVTWSNSLPLYLSDKIEWVQKRALLILFPNPHFNDALSLCKITRLDARRDNLWFRVWHSIRDHPESRLRRLLPPLRAENQPYNLRCSDKSSLPKCCMERY